MDYIKVLVIISLISSSLSCSGSSRHSKQIATFDTDSWAGWIKEGTAFGDGPAGDEGTHQMNGFLGHGYACSAGDLNATSIGTITSPPFTIENNTIHFQLGAQEIHFMAGSENHSGQLAVQLLIDDQVVRTKIPKEFHAMFWEGWDVSEYKGKTAKIKIIDNDPREWAHIDVDHIVNNNLPLQGMAIDRKIIIDKPILNLPVKQGNAKYYLELVVDGKPIRAMDVELATEEIDYWVVTDLTQWLDKELTVRTKLKHELNDKILDRISVENDILDSEDLYEEPLRQQFHFSSKRGWLNDPNGLVYYDGEYHLFYQHNPYGWDHSRNDYNKTWGHAVSTDLIYWEELAGVIHPDNLGSIYSGSSVVDHNNTTGFQSGHEKAIVAIYTSAGGRTPWSMDKKFSQSIAYSNDRGRTFTIFEGNPVLENLDYINRDPKAIWHEPTKQWVIVLHFDERAMVFFTSKDLKTWQKQSAFESRYLVDCPELFELTIDGDENNKKWVIYGGSGAYFVGDFDGKKFTPETEIIQYNFGNAFYASQTFSNVPKEDGRRIQMAWARIPTKGMPFNQSMLFPAELTLRTTPEGLRMFTYPVKEIEKLYSKKYTWEDYSIDPQENLLKEVKGDLLDIKAEFIPGQSDEFGFVINDIPVTYDQTKEQLKAAEEIVQLKATAGKIKLRILVDRISIEVFANDGQIYMPLRALPDGTKKGLEIFSKKGNTNISLLNVHELKSIWN